MSISKLWVFIEKKITSKCEIQNSLFNEFKIPCLQKTIEIKNKLVSRSEERGGK